jgi:hypothetical protein
MHSYTGSVALESRTRRYKVWIDAFGLQPVFVACKEAILVRKEIRLGNKRAWIIDKTPKMFFPEKTFIRRKKKKLHHSSHIRLDEV